MYSLADKNDIITLVQKWKDNKRYIDDKWADMEHVDEIIKRGVDRDRLKELQSYQYQLDKDIKRITQYQANIKAELEVKFHMTLEEARQFERENLPDYRKGWGD